MHRSDVEKLSLRGNAIGELSPDLIGAVQASLTQLDLRDNNLTTLRRLLFDGIPYLSRLLLEGNPLHCDCRLAWLRQLVPQVTIDRATCSSPGDVAGSLAIDFDVSACVNFTDEAWNSTDVILSLIHI